MKRKEVFEFTLQALVALQNVSKNEWAATFVSWFMRFCRKFKPGTFTTQHGANFFSYLFDEVNAPARYYQRIEKNEAQDKAYIMFLDSLV